MSIAKVLKRKDAASVIVAVVVAVLVGQAVQSWAQRPADWLSGVNGGSGGWREGLWRPLVTLVVGLLVLELVIRLYVLLAESFKGGR